ncbi:1-(5-phosphoribosyl)-5-[(5-phosphoribosylamino)methylideneamino]imidazole-4-carboxamide isomerase [Solitalea koreensis]|uniref:1-(5-phosphoribosyl)-5-[(5-phosphoribosylamino)methylideneamino] imidazole-4-carboxamide isomerase n=1 Tax=Solitalea koreensis TaxID=543615 RepID=A0A521BKB6_9SPHI|nr:1-(5-phosphoribosyl)-5-[(5-phosphoribosylamino)methylideneamino] imidazole-4-carboxamide isomerase [Solitalea koreensis]SMO47549.1 1-(5-phosphoribosyl)-5-[(5-phosphoribosylamino)methylideneamino] imidazole-4-carboxamide isomerase [Solitalea koreensis]
MYVIPAIDILDKKVVRLREGKYDDKTVYNVSLEEMLEKYISYGTNFIHIIDLNGAKGDFSNQQYVLEAVKKLDIKVQYGGGIRSINKVKELLALGFHRVIVGTQAITDPTFLEKLSKEVCGQIQCSDQVVIAIDVLDEVIKYSGWMESSPVKLMDYIDRCTNLGFFRFLCTDIDKDGKLAGSGVELYKKLLDHKPFIKLIASGGVSSIKDLEDLKQIKCESAVVGKAIYEGKVTVEEIKQWNLQSLAAL